MTLFIRIIAIFIFLISTNISADNFIKNVKVRGNQRVESETIKSYLNLSKNSKYSETKQRSIINRLYATSQFKTIKVSFINNNLIIDVKENPLLIAVEFKGNKKLSEKILTKELTIKKGDFLTENKIKNATRIIKRMYSSSGRYAVIVKSEIEQLENNRAKLIFNIVEGPKTKIREINFSGNDKFKASELKSIISTRESRWWMFMSTADTYDPDKIAYDENLLTEFYNSMGYADFRIISANARLAPTKEYFTVDFVVDEGRKYNLGKISIDNKIEEINSDELYNTLNLKTGDRYDLSAIRFNIEKLNHYFADNGFAFVAIAPQLDKHDELGVIDLNFIIQKAPKNYVRNINIVGNLKTYDHVIRRQMEISEDDAFNKTLLNRSERNIRNLNYFKKINVDVAKAGENSDQVDIDVNVEEQSTANINFQIGYSTLDDIFASVGFAESNLFGRGYDLDVMARTSKRAKTFSASVTDPFFMDRDLALTNSVFVVNKGKMQNLAFSNDEYGYSLGAGYDFAKDLYHRVNYTIKNEKLKAKGNAQNAEASALFGIKPNKKSFVTSSVGHNFTFDKLDNRMFPRNGYELTFGQDYAGLGGDAKYLKNDLGGKFVKSFFDDKLTFKVTANYGFMKGLSKDGIRVNDRYMLGGPLIRGFDANGIGPRIKGADGSSLGGKNYYTTSAELSFPIDIVKETSLFGSVYIDAGSVWNLGKRELAGYSREDVYTNKANRAAVGIGFLWVTKIAPIRVDYAIPIQKQKYDEEQRFLFRFTTGL